MTAKPLINVADVALMDGGNGKAFKAKVGSFGPQIGSTNLGAMLHVVEPGQKAFPFHFHHQVDELFVVLEGKGTYRFGSERFPVKAGDVCAAPKGKDASVGHQLINTGNATLRYLGISTLPATDVCVYPDSNKFAVMSNVDWTNPKKPSGLRFVGRTENSLDYFDGED